MLHIHPVAYPVGHPLPLVHVLEYALLALFDKGLDPVLFDLLLAVDAEGFFHFELDGQAVRIPARFA